MVILIQVGKNGLQQAMIDQARKHLKEKMDVKFKFLPSAHNELDEARLTEILGRKPKKVGYTLLFHGK